MTRSTAALAREHPRQMAGRALVPILAAAALSTAAPEAAEAQAWRGNDGWVSINARQDRLDHRIDMGIRRGQLNRREAERLRGQFFALARLEHQYRRGGLTGWERRDLDRRFDRLSARIGRQRHDRQRVDRWW